VAVGADPDRIALLDNFCWGNPEQPETLGSLVLAAKACHDLALAYRTPFISGKDSLYNEYVHEGRSQAIPPTLLISAMGQVPDVRRCVTMDLKEPGNALYVVGKTTDALGGSIWVEQLGLSGGRAPRVDPAAGRRIFQALHEAMVQGRIRACHDVSDGGLVAALAEMCLAGRLGARVAIAELPGAEGVANEAALLFAESPSRFVVEVSPAEESHFQEILTRLGVDAWGRVGTVDDARQARLVVQGRRERPLIDVGLDRLLASWKRTLED
jgi:phosphoribosylformylglycinamidine synthase